MTGRPILFTGAMVRAILAGGKGATRRMRGLERVNKAGDIQSAHQCSDGSWIFWNCRSTPELAAFTRRAYETGGFDCPYGRAGDTLWVREKWGVHKWIEEYHEGWPRYESDLIVASDPAPTGGEIEWKSPIFMPKGLAGIHLTITDSYPQRLHDITDAQALAEGVKYTEFYSGSAPGEPRAAFFRLWDSINAKRGYPAASNPWAWAVEFVMMEERGGT